jgi:hypothetical protein
MVFEYGDVSIYGNSLIGNWQSTLFNVQTGASVDAGDNYSD